MTNYIDIEIMGDAYEEYMNWLADNADWADENN